MLSTPETNIRCCCLYVCLFVCLRSTPKFSGNVQLSFVALVLVVVVYIHTFMPCNHLVIRSPPAALTASPGSFVSQLSFISSIKQYQVPGPSSSCGHALVHHLNYGQQQQQQQMIKCTVKSLGGEQRELKFSLGWLRTLLAQLYSLFICQICSLYWVFTVCAYINILYLFPSLCRPADGKPPQPTAIKGILCNFLQNNNRRRRRRKI